jgi:hypothetical protein
LSYQTTNPATNALTGTPDTPADITAGGDQTFVLSLTVNGAQPPTDTAIGFSCANADAAAIVSGIDTLLLSGSTSPVPDIVALAATASGNGTVDITGTNGTGAFAVASENVGAVGSITVSAAASETTLPLAVSICQTNPANGQCLAAPASSVTTTIDANATPTFSIFATASGAIDFSPAVNRIAVQFTDATGLVRGSTSVAVQTQ